MNSIVLFRFYELVSYMNWYHIWIDSFKKRFWTFHIYEVTSLHLNWLNSLTQPHLLKSWHIGEYVCMFLKLVVGAVMDKQGMVIMDEIDLPNIFVLGMEKLEYDKVMNPHRHFTVHIIVMGRNNTTICKLLNITNTCCPNSINLLTRPTYLIAWFVTKEFPSNIFTLSHAKMNKNFWFSWKRSLSNLFPNYRKILSRF